MAIGLLLLVLLTPFFVLLSVDLLLTLILVLPLLVFGLLLRVLLLVLFLALGLLLCMFLLVLFLALRLLLLLLWLSLLLLLLRSRLLLLCRFCLLFLSLRFGLFLLRSRFSLFLMLCWLSALLVVLFLRECRNSSSEKQKDSRRADDSKYFHCVLPPLPEFCVDFRLARERTEICTVVNTLGGHEAFVETYESCGITNNDYLSEKHSEIQRLSHADFGLNAPRILQQKRGQCLFELRPRLVDKAVGLDITKGAGGLMHSSPIGRLQAP